MENIKEYSRGDIDRVLMLWKESCTRAKIANELDMRIYDVHWIIYLYWSDYKKKQG